jgi:glycosyltransferase involved in cell wall biosynthesis
MEQVVSAGPAVVRSHKEPAAVPDARLDVAILLGRFGSGGVERVACHLANGIERSGRSVAIFAADPTGPALNLLNDGVAVQPLIGVKLRSRAMTLVLGIGRAARRIRQLKPRILLSPGNHTHVAAGLALWLSGARDTALVVKMTNPPSKVWHGAAWSFVIRTFYSWLFRRARSILVLSPAAIGQIGELAGTGAAAKARFVHNPYIPSTSVPARSETRSAPPLILTVGRLSAQKNLSLLIEAASTMTDLAWRIRVVGEGSEENALKQLADRSGIGDRVHFIGFVSDPTPHYRDATVLALPSKWEDLPAVALEAMAVGCPVVATDCSPALTELLSQTGFGRVVSLNPHSFAEALRDMVSNPRERRVPAEVHAFSIENGIGEHLAVLLPLLTEENGALR